jgi:hypothetical protein
LLMLLTLLDCVVKVFILLITLFSCFSCVYSIRWWWVWQRVCTCKGTQASPLDNIDELLKVAMITMVSLSLSSLFKCTQTYLVNSFVRLVMAMG